MSTVLKTLASSVCVRYLQRVVRKSGCKTALGEHYGTVSASYGYLVLTLPNQSSFSLKLSVVNIPNEASIVCALEACKGLEERNWFSYWVHLFEGPYSKGK